MKNVSAIIELVAGASSSGVRRFRGVAARAREALRKCGRATARRLQAATFAVPHAESERFFHTSLEMQCILSQEGHFLRLNQQWQNVLGYSLEEIHSKSFLELIHPEDRQALSDALYSSVERQMIGNAESRVRSKSGQYRWIEWRVTASDGKIYGVARDVTERRRVEADLKLLTERYAAAVSGTSDGLWDWRVGSDEVWYAERFWTLLGFPDTGPFPPNRGKSFRDRLHPEDIRTALDAIRSHSFEGAVYDVEFRLRVETGDYRWFRARGKTQRSCDGRSLRMAGSIQDVSERVQAQQLLEAAKANAEAALREVNALRTALDEHSLISIADRRGRIISANSGFCRISGYSAEELIGQDHRILNSGVHTRAFWTEIWRTIASGVAWRGEVCNRRKDGSLYWVDSTIVPYLDAEGRVDRYVSIRFDITAQKADRETLVRREGELAQQKRMLESVIESEYSGYWDWDISAQTQFYSPRWLGMLGYRPGELPAKPETWQRLIYPEDLGAALESFEHHIESRGESPFYNEARYRSRDGSTLWMMCLGQVVEWGANGEPLRMVGSHIDITARKSAEERLRNRERDMRMIFSAVPGVIYRCKCDHEWTMDWISDGIVDLVGYPPQSFVRNEERSFASVIHPEDRQMVQDAVFAAVEAQRAYDIHYRVIHRSGEVRWVQERGAATDDERHEGQSLIGFIIDITERKATDDALTESHRRLQLALDATNTGLWEWSFCDNRTYYNDSWYTMLGYDVGELPMSLDSWREICHPDDLVRAYEEIQQYLAGKRERYQCQQRLRRKDGSWMWINDVGKVVAWDENGLPVRMIGVHIDIQAHKVSEAALTKATDAALAASKAKSEFLANMSHEIRTPMNGVLGMLELLLDTPQTEEQQDLAKTAHQSAESLLAIINDILDFSKIEAGKIELRPKQFSLRGFLKELEKLHDIRAQQKGITLVANIEPTIPDELVADETRLRQVLINLISNALKFTPEGGAIVLNVDKDSEGEDGLKLLFHVTDTGIGIPAGAQQRIFESFEQADSSTTREYGGTGLGLAISARLVALMGGEIGLRSQEGKGSVFYFSGRFGLATSRPAAAHEQKRSQRSEGSATLQKLKVLVAEDNAVNQKLVKRILENAGHEVVLANDGQEAVKLFGSTPFDLVLMDIQMPVMGGEEAAARIRATGGGYAVPIIAVTANAITGDRERYLQAGLDGYVAKPISRDELFSVIEQVKGEKTLR